MIKPLALHMTMLFALIISPVHYASGTNLREKAVTRWTQNILMDSLTASYRDTQSDIESVQKYYSHAAWDPMNLFFDKELKAIYTHKLTLHPKPLNNPTVSHEDNCQVKPCWRVNQSYNLPELHLKIDFSLLIIRSSTTEYLIQSLNMKVDHY
ncbi:hypothetical protein [Legionella bononiensis]|uniref:Protein IcmL (DotI) n=1 Tax=Legionella bononiensis TaxID=2793102 RepID=A0ABS1W7Q9_9GAMM|nr:hypothetical protein [Legionella bononiensis]MBL7480096.1 hypothetical protein [Legionella bononiensis]MBL7525389.1 hypothetical protein [Legionella bononiensis]MBL7561573.1 hypothetical protein [Legionella bononiensis]